MSDVVSTTGIVAAPVIGFTAWSLIESTDSVLHVVVGVLMVIVTLVAAPLIRWMIRRMDGQTKQDIELTAAREKREEKRLEAYDRQVTALTALVGHMEMLIAGHREVMHRLDQINETLNEADGNLEDETL